MNIIVSGLGIIGGSMAKAVKKYTDHHVIGMNRSFKPLESALACGAIDEIGTPDSLGTADMLILGTFPEAAVAFVRKYQTRIKKGCIVIDTSGIKSEICPELKKLSEENGFVFVGCHPMAGKETNGFDSSEAELFQNASCILVPCGADATSVKTVEDLMKKLGFGMVVYASPEEHDRMIAFTSQLPHVLACAYVQSPCCLKHKGFSAGSYRDVSRVAHINAELWSELFIENKEALLTEINCLENNIQNIKQAIQNQEKEKLKELLSESRRIKEALGE